MFLNTLGLRGFRCYGPNATLWELGEASYVIVGPANAGKSTLATALEWSLGGGATPQDFFGGRAPAALSITAKLKLIQSEALELAAQLFGKINPQTPAVSPQIWEWIAKALVSNINYEVQATYDERGQIVRNAQVRTDVIVPDVSTNVFRIVGVPDGVQTDWREFLTLVKGLQIAPDTPFAKFQETLTERGIGKVVVAEGVTALLVTAIRDRVRLLPEVRVRPGEKSGDAIETWDGNQLGGVLGAMYAGSPEDRERFKMIERIFESLHQPVKIFPQRRDNQWQLRFRIPTVEEPVSAQAVGMGTVQGLLLITNLLMSRGRVIVLEEPELHLHPPAQRALLAALRKAASANQVIIVTHSTDILDEEGDYRVVRLRPFDPPEKVKFQTPALLKSLNPVWVRRYVKDSLFAKVSLLVEGVYDLLVFENLLNLLYPDWKAAGIAIVPVDGKTNVAKPFKYLQGLGIDACVCLDDDALTKTETQWKQDSRRKPICWALAHAARAGVIAGADLEGILKQGAKVGSNALYPAGFVDAWRKKLRGDSWFVLTDTLDHLIT